MKLLIFTDVDGTLIDHFTYRWDEAVPVLALLKALDIPVILNTSKTYDETSRLVEEMGLRSPFAVENGAAIIFPEDFSPLPSGCRRVGEGYCALVLGKEYGEVRGFFKRYAEEYGLRGMGDMDTEELVALTGLPRDRVSLMRRRMFTEPFITTKPERLDEFVRLAEGRGFKVLRGGRFYHLISSSQDKGRVVRIIRNLYGENTMAVGLGDSENDLDMLKEVDLPILIPNPKRGYAKINLPNLVRAKCLGPKGWAEEVLKVVRTLNLA